MLIYRLTLIAAILFFCAACSENDGNVVVLTDNNPMQLKSSINYIVEHEIKGKTPELLTIAKDTAQDKELRIHAIKAVGDLGGNDDAGALLAVLDSESDNDTRKAIVEVLGILKSRDAGPVLQKMLLSESGTDALDENLRLTTIWALGNIGDKSAVPVLSGLRNVQDEYVSYNACQALKQISNQE